MPKFNRDARVIFEHKGAKHRGKVTGVKSHARRIVTDSGKRMEIPVRRLKHSPDRALILETRLDRSLKSKRTYGPMLTQWLSAYGVEALYERVHTVEALRQFLRREGRNIATRFVHISGHGSDEPGIGTASLHLTFESLDLGKQADVFAGLDEKVIIFSCCEIGADRRVMETIKEASAAAGVIGYRVDVDDHYANLAEVMLFDRLINDPGMSPAKAVELVTRRSLP